MFYVHHWWVSENMLPSKVVAQALNPVIYIGASGDLKTSLHAGRGVSNALCMDRAVGSSPASIKCTKGQTPKPFHLQARQRVGVYNNTSMPAWHLPGALFLYRASLRASNRATNSHCLTMLLCQCHDMLQCMAVLGAMHGRMHLGSDSATCQYTTRFLEYGSVC